MAPATRTGPVDFVRTLLGYPFAAMGRCYEFGVVVGEGCEHAMVVTTEGGECQCGTCGAGCAGRFAACEAILGQPGYIPVTAPAWAVTAGEGGLPQPTGTDAGPGPEAAAPTLGGAGDRSDLVELVERVAKDLAEHDVVLAGRVDGLAEQVAQLQRVAIEQGETLAQALSHLQETIVNLASQSPRGPLFGFSPPRSQMGDRNLSS